MIKIVPHSFSSGTHITEIINHLIEAQNHIRTCRHMYKQYDKTSLAQSSRNTFTAQSLLCESMDVAQHVTDFNQKDNDCGHNNPTTHTFHYFRRSAAT